MCLVDLSIKKFDENYSGTELRNLKLCHEDRCGRSFSGLVSFYLLGSEQLHSLFSEESSVCCFHSGMAERNANFEALPEDWRARLKRRKMAPNT